MNYVVRNGRRIEVETLPSNTVPKKQKRRTTDLFVRTPLSWLNRLKTVRRARSSTYRVALHLLHENWKTGGRPVQFSNVAAVGAGVSAREKWRALGELERLGLILIERRPGKSPIIVVIARPDPTVEVPRTYR